MPTTDVTNTLTATITSQEQSTSNIPINRSTGNPAFNANVGSFITYLALAGGAQPLALPSAINPTTQVYLRNIDPTKTLTVAWTPNGGALNNVIVLNPGDQIIFWCNPGGVTTPGVTAITLTPSAAGCLIEYFLGA